MGLARRAQPAGQQPTARGATRATWLALGLFATAGPGCNDEAYFHLLRPADTPIPASGGAGGASGGAPPVSAAGAGGAGGGDMPRSSLIHRYDFEGTGTTLIDRVGDQHGTILGGAELSGEGSLLLDGNDDYVALPSGLISSLPGVTFAAWLEWHGTPMRCWQRIFDFGSNDAEVLGDAGQEVTSIFATASDCRHNALLAALDFPGNVESVHASDALPMDVSSFVAVVLANAEERFELYLDGELVGASDRPGRQLEEIDDRNNWLGRSQWVQDQVVFLRARYEEFRIYDRGLSAEEIRQLADLGPDFPSSH